jgi:hypothetical protein
MKAAQTGLQSSYKMGIFRIRPKGLPLIEHHLAVNQLSSQGDQPRPREYVKQ